MPLLTRKQVAARLQVSVRTDRAIKDEQLPAVKIGRTVRIRPCDLETFIGKFMR